MTPKEKAAELIKRFSPLVTTWDCYWDAQRDEEGIISDAKKCASIAVDEIINGYEFDSLDIEHKRIMDNINYWDEVKEEINKL